MRLPRKTVLILWLLLAAGVGITYAVLKPDQSTDTSATESQGQGSPNDTDTKTGSNTKPEPKPDSQDEAVAKKTATVTMTRPVEGQEFSGDTVQVRALISGATNGTCTVKFSKTGYRSVQASSSLVAGPSYYSCRGFDIDRSQFPADGQWSVVVEFSSDTAEGKSETRTVILQ